nr:MAG TPA: hypothetical protein [Caudoviricetes sp.]
MTCVIFVIPFSAKPKIHWRFTTCNRSGARLSN